MEPIVIDTTYYKITENNSGMPGDYYFIYPFDAFGNMYKRIQIDVDLKEDWNAIPIIITMPEIATLNYIFDLKISITAYPYTGAIIIPSPPIVVAGNNNDAWTFEGQIYGAGSMVWTPQSYNPAPTYDPTYPFGSWCVVPQYSQGGIFAPVANRTLDGAEAQTETSFSVDWSLYTPKKKKR